MTTNLRETLSRIEALPDSALLTEDEAAAFLRLAAQTLANDRSTRRLGIPFCRLGRAIRYQKGGIAHWLDVRTVRNKAE